MEDMTWLKDIKEPNRSFIIQHVFMECSKRLEQEVYEAEETLGTAMIVRFLSEMGTIIGCGYYVLYWILSWERIKAKKKHRIVMFDGQTSYSFVAYLMGLTKEENVLIDCAEDLLFSPNRDKPPYMTLVVPVGCRPDSPNLISWRESQWLTELEKAFAKNGEELDEEDYDQCMEQIYDWRNAYDFYKNKPWEEKKFAAYKSAVECYIRSLGEDADPELSKELLENADSPLWERLVNGSREPFLNLISMIRGTGVYRANGGTKCSGKSGIFSWDDVFYYMEEQSGGDREIAFQAAESVRKGKGADEDVQKMLKEHGAEEEFCAICAGIKYLVNEGSCLLIMRQICAFARRTGKLTEE